MGSVPGRTSEACGLAGPLPSSNKDGKVAQKGRKPLSTRIPFAGFGPQRAKVLPGFRG